MDYDKPRGAPTGGVELTEKERQALDMYVITPRALPGVMHIIDMQDKVDALTAFHEKGSVVEPFEDAISGGPFGNQHGFTCEDLCRKQAGSAFGQLALRRLLSAPGHASGCPKPRLASANQPAPAALVGHSGLVFDAGEDDCWVTTIEDEQTPAKRGYLVIACVGFHAELRPLLDLYLWLAGKTFQWCDGEASVAGVSVENKACMAGQHGLTG